MKRRFWVVAILWIVLPNWAWANETDQFTLPPREEFVDLGPMMSQVHLRVLDRVVARLNKRIEQAQKLPEPQRRWELRPLQDPLAAADAIRAIFGPGMFEMNTIELTLDAGRGKKLFPGKRIAYRTMFWIYSDVHLPFDPRKLPLLFPSSTMKIYGVFLGADKVGHFHDLGHLYYRHYRMLRDRGLSEAEAEKNMVWTFSRGPISEDAVIGRFATGVRSNADLAVNFIGYKFYRNLSEPVRLRGQVRPPLLVLDEQGFWHLNEHVLPYSDFFRWYISDHYNEALNPGQYELGMRWSIQRRLRLQASDILAFYADDAGQPRPRQWFEHKARELSTYYGEDYGYLGEPDRQAVTIANSCFDVEQDASNPTKLTTRSPEQDQADASLR